MLKITPNAVIPAKAGIHQPLFTGVFVDSGFRRNDESTFSAAC
jgi:hypothetical protein